ncbi:hypothetical protein [Mycolicibacterium conceptionense]|uniref:hypothetical protein n=1 Tax=Mycolicibacterium conceptionense TaxID=451644 RepID=UPI001056E04E|nr:hypothetical protein [Mycolicibacterium conceptionense]
MTRFADRPPRDRPAVLAAEPVELWILRAISPNSRPAMFGVEVDGAVCTADRTGRYQIFVSGLSRLLDEAADACRLINGGGRLLLVERGGRFFASLEADGDQALAVVDFGGHQLRQPSSKSFWQRVVAFLPWVHDEPENDCAAASVGTAAREQPADPWSVESDGLNARSIHQLVVDFETGSWRASSFLKTLGYEVGKNGLGPELRRRILRDALTVELVATTVEAESYLREWGSPNSRQRAARIERHLTWLADNAKRRDADMSEAIADWESDLAWFTRECSH